MSKVRKSTIGTTALDSMSTPLDAVLGHGQQTKNAPAPAAVPAKIPTTTKREEQKPKAARRTAARTERSNTLTVEAVVDRTVYTRDEAARYLGTSPATLWRIAQAGQDVDGKRLGHTRIGTRVRFLREDLDRYARSEAPRDGAVLGWAKDEDRAERMRQQHAARKAQG